MSLLHLKCSQPLLHLSSDLLQSHNLSMKIPFPNPQISVNLNNKNIISSSGSSRKNNTRFHTKCSSKQDPTSTTQSFDDKNTVSSSPKTNFLTLLCPLLKLFAGGDPSQERNSFLEVGTSSLSTLARFPWGSRSLSESSPDLEIVTKDPPMRLQLFEFEACPFCRRVREAVTELDLSVEVYPCPKGSVRHREMVREMGGKEQFPYLVDPNTGISTYESGDIVKYLFQQYGQGRSPSVGLLESTLVTGWMPTILRAGRGMMLWERARLDAPPQKLELFSYENNPYARIVREALCELELPYILQNVGKGSLRSKLLLETSGSMEVPFLIDPNTGTQMGDYKKILSYLFRTYSIIK